MKFDHPADFYMLIALSIAMVCVWASCARAEEPIMETTINSPTITEWIMQNNPPCTEDDKIFSEYGHVATDWQKECKRWRPWQCRTSGQKGVDIEPLPAVFCSDK